jgi:hypothetical protein
LEEKSSSGIFDDLKIYRAPHPARAWWNRPSVEYDNSTGKEFVQNILSTKKKIKIKT